jgi:hypothetical protein
MIPDSKKREILNIINKSLEPKGYKAEIKVLKENTAIFPRGVKNKMFSEEMVKIIKEDKGSIRDKATKYGASISTIMKIMSGKY